MKLVNACKKTYANFLFPGSFVPEESLKEVKNRELNELSIPENCFAVEFFDSVTAEVEIDGEIFETSSRRINQSSKSYINATIMTKDDVADELGNDSTLFRNMEYNDWNEVIKCVTGNFQPFNKGDIVVNV